MRHTQAPTRYASLKLNHLLTLFATLASLVLVCLLVRMFPIEVPSRESIASVVFIFLGDVRPEPMERRMFLVCVAVLPFIIIVWHLVCKKYISEWSEFVIRNISILTIAVTVVIVAFYFYLVRKEITYFNNLILAGGEWGGAVSILFAGVMCYSLYRNNERALSKINFLVKIITTVLLLSVFFYCLYDVTTVSDDAMYYVHFNVIFHAMSQVFLGKELLVDYVHQYGLYPHFLEPLFRITGLSFLSFSMTIGALTALTFIFLLRTLQLVVANRLIALLGLLALVSGGYISKIMSSYDPYFQYFPLRTIFPATASWVLVRYLKNKTTLSFIFLYSVAAIAVLWNPETGIVVLIAVFLTTIYDEWFTRSFKSAAMLASKGVAVSVITISFFSCYMFLRYGTFPDFRELIRYTKIFYGIGFYMLPMELLHPWNLVAVIYIGGLIWGLGGSVYGQMTLRTTVVTYLSLLGIGLFAYYQGRSHNEVFLLCIYPAYLVLTIFIDSLLSLGKECRSAQIVGCCGVCFLVFIAGGLYNGVRTLYLGEVGIIKRFEQYRRGLPSEIMRRADFVKDRTNRGEEVLILSGHSGLFHLVSQTTNPIHTPSVQETVLLEDFQYLLSYVDHGACRKLFVDVGEMVYSNPSYMRLRSVLATKYVSSGISPDLSLAMFVRVR